MIHLMNRTILVFYSLIRPTLGACSGTGNSYSLILRVVHPRKGKPNAKKKTHLSHHDSPVLKRKSTWVNGPNQEGGFSGFISVTTDPHRFEKHRLQLFVRLQKAAFDHARSIGETYEEASTCQFPTWSRRENGAVSKHFDKRKTSHCTDNPRSLPRGVPHLPLT